MKRINILVISGCVAVILFVILTVLQNKIVNKEAMVTVYMATIDIMPDIKVNKSDYKEVIVPVSLTIEGSPIVKEKDLEDKYPEFKREDSLSSSIGGIAQSSFEKVEHTVINKGQIIFKQDIASKEELKIIEAVDGLERIALKIKSSENAVAYQIKPKDRIHLYFTGKSGILKRIFSKYGIKYDVNMEDTLLQTEKIISDTEILGIYDEAGREYENSNFSRLDTIVIAVDSNMAQILNNLRTQGTFDITR